MVAARSAHSPLALKVPGSNAELLCAGFSKILSVQSAVNGYPTLLRAVEGEVS